MQSSKTIGYWQKAQTIRELSSWEKSKVFIFSYITRVLCWEIHGSSHERGQSTKFIAKKKKNLLLTSLYRQETILNGFTDKCFKFSRSLRL